MLVPNICQFIQSSLSEFNCALTPMVFNVFKLQFLEPKTAVSICHSTQGQRTYFSLLAWK